MILNMLMKTLSSTLITAKVTIKILMGAVTRKRKSEYKH